MTNSAGGGALPSTRSCPRASSSVGTFELRLLFGNLSWNAIALSLSHTTAGSESPAFGLTSYDLAMGWISRTLVEESETSADDADHLLDFAMAGLLRDETER